MFKDLENKNESEIKEFVDKMNLELDELKNRIDNIENTSRKSTINTNGSATPKDDVDSLKSEIDELKLKIQLKDEENNALTKTIKEQSIFNIIIRG